MPDTPLLFMTIESAVSTRFEEHVVRMVRGGRLDRVIVDEAHMIVIDLNFRTSYENINWFAELGVQILFLTATLPKYMEGELGNLAGTKGATIIRMSGRRSNITYEIRKVKNILAEVKVLLEGLSFEGPERCIIYCHYKAQCDSVAKAIGLC